MKKSSLLSFLLLFAIITNAQKITRGPNVGEIYFLGPTYTGTGLYYSTNFGETAVCVDSVSTTNYFIEAITADKTPGGLYFVTMGEALYYSDNYGQFGSWDLQSGGVSYRIGSGRNEGEFYNTISSHSIDYGVSFNNHSLNGYFGNLLECEIDCEFPYGYAIVFQMGITDSIYLLFTQDNYENIELQNSFHVNYYSNAEITRGFSNGEIYLYLAQNSYSENLLLRSTNYGETFDTIEPLNLSNFYQLGFEGGRQEGEIIILYSFINLMWVNAHIYIFHSVNYGRTFEVYHPFAKGNEPVLANFSTIDKEVHISAPVEFSNFSLGEIQEYQWDFENDGIIDSYQKDPVYTYADTGWYSVKLSVIGPDSTNTFVKTNYIHVIDTITTVHENSIEKAQIIPNPFKERLTVSSLIPTESYSIIIYNFNGIEVMRKNSHGIESININTIDLKPGIYVLSISSQNNSSNFKIIKK